MVIRLETAVRALLIVGVIASQALAVNEDAVSRDGGRSSLGVVPAEGIGGMNEERSAGPPPGCDEVVDGAVGGLWGVVLTVPAAIRDLIEVPLRLPYVLIGAIDPGHPANYVFLPFVALGSIHSFVFFSGTDAGYEDGRKIIFESTRCRWYLFPNLRALW